MILLDKVYPPPKFNIGHFMEIGKSSPAPHTRTHTHTHTHQCSTWIGNCVLNTKGVGRKNSRGRGNGKIVKVAPLTLSLLYQYTLFL